MPLSVNTAEVEICWPLSSAMPHGWEIPRCRDYFGEGGGVKVYGAMSTPDATGRAPDEGDYGKHNLLAKYCDSLLKST